MQTTLATRLFNALALAVGAAGVRWSGDEYRYLFEGVFYLSLAGVLFFIFQGIFQATHFLFWQARPRRTGK